jgi:hypothetical protein
VLAFGLGNFVKQCRREMRPYRLTSVVTPQHGLQMVPGAFADLLQTRPQLPSAGEDRHTTGGQEGWQYQNLNQTMIITLRNKKLKAFYGCL